MTFSGMAVACALLVAAILASCTNVHGGPEEGAESPRPIGGPLCDPPDPVCAEVVTFGQTILEIVGATGIDSRVKKAGQSFIYETRFVVRHFSAASVADDYRFTFELEDREGDASWKALGLKLVDGTRVLRFRGMSHLAVHDVRIRLTTLKKEKIGVEATIEGRPIPD